MVPDAPEAPASRPFVWQDGERTVRFGRGAVADGAELLGDGYLLLTTERAAAALPAVAARAARVVHLGPERVDALAGDLLDAGVAGALVVALGGGRAIDTAKSLVAAGGGERVAAIPTTLSAAEMTGVHRPARGALERTGELRFVRPAVVLNDPALSASLPLAALAASAGNALAHAVEGPLTPRASPVPVLAARRAADLLAQGLADADAPDRDALALGALLSGSTIDSTGYGLHHVLSQTLVREAGAGHGPANAALLPHTARVLAGRFPGAVRAEDVALADRLARLTGTPRLRDQGIDRGALAACAAAAAQRAELDLTPPRATEEELRAVYDAAW